MSTEETLSMAIEERLQALVEYRAYFKALGEMAERYKEQAEEARRLLHAQDIIEAQIREGSPQSLAEAEAGIQEIAEHFLGAKR
jgi:hypothetical protein